MEVAGVTHDSVQSVKWRLKTFVVRLVWVMTLPILKSAASQVRQFVALTCIRGDGLGAQLHARASVFALCQEIGIEYRESAFYPMIPDPEPELQKKLAAIVAAQGSSDFDGVEIRQDALGLSPLRLLIILFRARSGGNPVLIGVREAHSFTNSFPSTLRPYFHRVLPVIARAPKLMSERKGKSAVIHLRRGLMNQAEFRARKESPGLLDKALSLQAEIPDLSVTICAFELSSQESRQLPEGWHVRTGESLVEDIWLGINADFFFCAKSSLSYAIASASKGQVFYQRFWHPKMQDWFNL